MTPLQKRAQQINFSLYCISGAIKCMQVQRRTLAQYFPSYPLIGKFDIAISSLRDLQQTIKEDRNATT